MIKGQLSGIIVYHAQKNHSTIKTTLLSFHQELEDCQLSLSTGVRDFSQVACPFSISTEQLVSGRLEFAHFTD